MGRTLWGIILLLILQDAAFWDARSNFWRFRQRTDPLIVIELPEVGFSLSSRT